MDWSTYTTATLISVCYTPTGAGASVRSPGAMRAGASGTVPTVGGVTHYYFDDKADLFETVADETWRVMLPAEPVDLAMDQRRLLGPEGFVVQPEPGGRPRHLHGDRDGRPLRGRRPRPGRRSTHPRGRWG